MKQYYESEILFQLMERDGLNIPSSVPPYETEIKAYLINQVKQAYPKLTDYEAEWLLYNYTKHLPAEFPISSVSDVTEATFENVVPFAYQSAILKGKTDENLQSVKMPVLTTAGKNLFNEKYQNLSDFTYDEDGIRLTTNKRLVFQSPVKIQANKTYIGLIEYSGECASRGMGFNDVSQNGVYPTYRFIANNGSEVKVGRVKITPTSDTYLVSIHNGFDHNGVLSPKIHKVAIFESSNINESYEPYKSNILTVNGDVTLRSNGDVYDELNLLTGRLTQRIDENNEVLSQEVVKTVDLTNVNEKGETTYFMPLEGTMSVQSSGEIIKPTFDMSVPIEATTQNLASFIDLEMRE